MPELLDYLHLMAVGYLLTIAIETTVLALGLSRRHPLKLRLFAGLWLTACTYPIVWIVLPPLFDERWAYLVVAEVFAPVAECLLFRIAFIRGLEPQSRATLQDFFVVTLANLLSFACGELLMAFELWG